MGHAASRAPLFIYFVLAELQLVRLIVSLFELEGIIQSYFGIRYTVIGNVYLRMLNERAQTICLLKAAHATLALNTDK